MYGWQKGELQIWSGSLRVKGNDTVLQMISLNVGPTTDININGTKPVQNEFSWSHSNNLYVNLSKCSVFNYETWLQKKF